MDCLNICISISFLCFIVNSHCENTSQSSNADNNNNNNTEIINETTEFSESITTVLPDIVTQSTTVKSLSSPFWMSKTQNVDDNLINIQAIIVKDEEAQMPCNKGERKSERRYLMCAGSILDVKHILTSASCLHEALHIRHNIHGALAVAIAPLKSTVQIIRVAEYRIHPNHNTNPYSKDYMKHNLAVLSLECEIHPENYHRIELPNRPMNNYCNNGNCIVAVYRIVGYTSNVLSQRLAPNTHSWESPRRRDINHEFRVKRSSDGSHFCAATGSAVMVNTTQVAIVAISCDDRNPNSKWLYTDLYQNQAWINNILEDWNKTNSEFNSKKLSDSLDPLPPSGVVSKNCENCIFNFYISIGCKGKANCHNRTTLNGLNTQVKTLRWQKNKSCPSGSLNCTSNVIDSRSPSKFPNVINNASKIGFRAVQLMEKPGLLNASSGQGKKMYSADVINPMDKYPLTNWQKKNQNGEVRRRIKRGENVQFITKTFDDNGDNIMKMQGLIVRDRDPSFCCTIAKQVSEHRYFMCSAAILTPRHAITTASCMHYADIYEHHIDADLAFMIGATSGDPYIIKINRYEMHPNYVVDVDAKDHATHNLAILFLACSIKSEAAIIPKFPRGINDDIGHMCCSRNCSVVTIIQNYDNHHVAKKLRAKNIPSPQHDQLDVRIENLSRSLAQKTIFKIPNIYPSMREKRSQVKLAPAPALFLKDTLRHGDGKPDFNNWGRTKTNAQIPFDDRYKNASMIAKILAGGIFRKVNGRRSLSNISMNDEAITSVDWNNVEEAMEQKISLINKSVINEFVDNVVKETMKRVVRILGDNESSAANVDSTSGNAGEKSTFFTTLLSQSSGNRSIDDFSRALIRIISNLMPPNDGTKLAVSSDLSIDEKNVGKPPPKYVECPPLGTPVFINGTLVGMIAYTCDDMQNWVEWKYVSISNNIMWLRKRLQASQHQSVTICDDASHNQDSLQNKSASNFASMNMKPLQYRRPMENNYKSSNDYIARY